jgi:hypothetical protein
MSSRSIRSKRLKPKGGDLNHSKIQQEKFKYGGERRSKV